MLKIDRHLLGAMLITAIHAPGLEAQIQITAPSFETSPVIADLNGVDAAEGGEAVAVGNDGTVIRRSVDPGGAVFWSSEGAWAATYFTQEILDVALSPVTYPGGTGWAIAGRGAVVETDFTTTTVVDQRPAGMDVIFTPVRPTADEIWYGEPNFTNLGLSFLYRYDRVSGQSLGIRVEAPILDICQIDGGPARYLTVHGDVFEVGSDLLAMRIYDHPTNLGLQSGAFAPDCLFAMARRQQSSTETYSILLDWSGSAAPTWQEDGTEASDDLSFQGPQGPSVEQFTEPGTGIPVALKATRRHEGRRAVHKTACNDLEQLSREKVHVVRTNRREGLAIQRQGSCQTVDTVIRQLQPIVVLARGEAPRGEVELLPEVDAYQALSVGNGGVISTVNVFIAFFFDDFEDGTFGAWSSAVGGL